MEPSTLRVIECPRAGCGRIRSGPCGMTCHLTSGAHFAEMEREARLAAERREAALQRIEEYRNGTHSPHP